jgi:hypothetical protein
MLKASRPLTSVTCLRLLRSTRLIVIFEVASSSARRASAAVAFASFFFASFSARFWASTERVERLAATASMVEGSQRGASIDKEQECKNREGVDVEMGCG